MKFDALQKEALYKIYLKDDSCIKFDPELISHLMSVKPDIMELALGKFGRKLAEFLNIIDTEHPDVDYFVNRIFQNDTKLQILELIELASKCGHLSKISANFHKLINLRHLPKKLQAIRLVKETKKREALRKEKSIQKIDLKNICSKGSEFWNYQPFDFTIFNRYNDPYLKDVENFKHKADLYLDIGCKDIVSKIKNEIQQLKTAFEDCYYGFNRITLSRASLILAKMHGCRFKVSWDRSDNKANSIVTSSSEPYCPKVYPLHEVIFTASKDMLHLIDHLDSFPAINHKPLFDNYLILTPAAANPCPILLGERDNKCYFICYWR